jgi:threonine/homoserine/homoserine lactone efflux protein
MIWTALGQSMPAAVGIAISPIPIVLVILMLVSARAKVNGLAFMGGWMLGVLTVTGLAYFLADGADVATDTTASDTANIGQLLLGLLFVALAVRQWRSRPRPGVTVEPPKLFAAVDSMGGGKAAGLGFLAAAANPKNLPLAASAGIGMAQLGVTGSDGAIAVLLFTVLASATVAAPVIVYFAMGDRAASMLAAWKTWLMDNNATVMMVLFAVLGAKMIGAGMGVFS